MEKYCLLLKVRALEKCLTFIRFPIPGDPSGPYCYRKGKLNHFFAGGTQLENDTIGLIWLTNALNRQIIVKGCCPGCETKF